MLPRTDEGWVSLFNDIYFWATIFGVIFGIVAIAASRWALTYSNRVSERQKSEIASTQKSAADANERASKAELQSATLNERARALEVDAEQAKKGQEDIRNANLSLALELEKARAQVLELKLQLEPRSISQKQQSAMVDILRAGAGHKFTIEFPKEHEIEQFAATLISVFQRANWQLAGTINPLSIKIYRPGVHVAFGNSRIGDLNLIGRALSAGGVKGKLSAERSPVDGDLAIEIGPKP